MATGVRTLLAGAFLAAAALAGAPAGASAAATVSVFPIPAGHSASPQTQITIRGVPASQIGPVTVTGSASGVHSGHIAADSDGAGGSFIPDRPFTAGETVSVTTGLTLTGTSTGSWSFSIANPATPFPVLHWPPASRRSGDVQFFHSRPDLSPVSVSVTKRGAGGDGDIFLAPQWGPVEDGPMILDPSGNLIWFNNMKGHRGADSATDFRVQTFNRRPVLTWWEGTLIAGLGIGQDVIFDNTYRQIATVHAGNGLQADEHEFQLTPQGTALVTAAYPVYVDARSVHGSTRQLAVDMAVQEIDIPTGLVLFEWHSLGHVPVSDSFFKPTKGIPFDYFHVNSAAEMPDGSLLVSARNIRAIYDIDRASGGIVWTLGGKHSTFKLPKDAVFSFQHDARPGPNGTITLFDNEGTPAIR
jgi:hypothetical protein